MATGTQQSETLDLTRPGIIEASAGTGKTYTIAKIYLALLRGEKQYSPSDENPPSAPKSEEVLFYAPRIRDILVVTFTEAATAELRDRLRTQIREALEAAPESETLAHDALRLADAEFDEAAVFTIHGFCLRVLKEFGISLKTDTIRTSVSDELQRFVERWRAREIAAGNDSFLNLPTSMLISAMSPLLKNPEIVPVLPENADTTALALFRAATQALDEWNRYRKSADSISYNEILTELRDALIADPALAAKIARRYRIAIVDEFQDTDPIQWEIFSRIFLANRNPLFCVGDPKQAIYEFRGGDITTYRCAREKIRTDSGGNALTLRENFRSEPEIIEAFNEIFAFDATTEDSFNVGTFKDPKIISAPVKGALEYLPTAFPLKKITDENREQLLAQTKLPAAILKLTPEQTSKKSAKELILESVVNDIEDLVKNRGVPARDIAVLLAENDEAHLYRNALAARSIPVSTTARGNVLCDPIASALSDILHAMLEPQSTPRFKRALLTPFFKEETKTRLLAPDDTEAETASEPLRLAFSEAHARWARNGFLSAFCKLSATLNFAQNLSLREHASALAINNLHLCELIHAMENAGKLTPRALVDAYDTKLATASKDDDDEALQLRAAVDRNAVRILTVHKSKGLEFEIVFLPSLWEKNLISTKTKPLFVKQSTAHGITQLLFRNENQDPPEFRQAELKKNYENAARLFYVALTRAKRRLVIYHPLQKATRNPWNSYQRQLFSAAGLLNFQAKASLQHWRILPTVEVLPYDAFPKVTVLKTLPSFSEQSALISPDKAEKRFALAESALRKISATTEGLFSFSRIIKASESDTTGLREDDENVTAEATGTPSALEVNVNAEPAPESAPETFPQKSFLTLPSGKEFGTVTHSIFERVNFQTCENLHRILTNVLPHLKSLPEKSSREYQKLADALADMVRENLALPLLGKQFSLNQLNEADEIREMEFYFPLKQSRTLYADLFRIFKSWGGIYAETADYHWSRPDLSDTLNVGGMMTGIIDLTFRADGKYYVLDWKTNSIVSTGVPAEFCLPAEAIRKEIVKHGYALQWAIYALALRKFLKQSLGENYSHTKNFGGIIYLFVRWCAPFYDDVTMTEKRLLDLEKILVRSA